jgi:hypothetical protein
LKFGGLDPVGNRAISHVCLAESSGPGGKMETHEFRNSAEFINWARRIVKGQYLAYDRAPVGKQTWTYDDGHMVETTWGIRKGTMLTNLSYLISIVDGKLTGDPTLVKDIDARGGLTLSIDWGE